MVHLSKPTMNAVSQLIARAFEAKLAGDGRPFIVAHFITHRCMCKCASCLWKHNDWEDVPLADIKRFYDQAREQRFMGTAFSGGEPFLRRDFGEIVRHVKQEAGMYTLSFTTGYFLQRRMHEVLPWLDLMVVSLDSAQPARHDAIRGVDGLFERAVQGVQEARAAYPDLSVQLNTCVQKGIEPEVDDLIALARRLGVRISFDVITEYRHGEGEAGEQARAVETDCGLPPDAVRRVCERLLAAKRAGAPIVNSDRYFQYFIDGRPGYHCHHPKIVMSVDGRGNLENCLNLSRPLGNIRDTPLAELLDRPRFRQLRRDAEQCCSCCSPTMVDMSCLWENPGLAFLPGGIEVG